MRWVFIGVGLAMLGASAHMSIHAAGGIGSEAAPGLIGMALLLAVGSAAMGRALADRHVGIAVVIGFGMLAGEVGAMVNTAQRVTAARSAMRSPILEAETQRAAASARLDRAEEGVRKADGEIAAKAALPGCKVNCRQLLQDAKDKAVRERDDARTALAAVPAPKGSATALADATGWQQWVLDLIEALSVSLAVNLPASALIALGVKMGAKNESDTIPTSAIEPAHAKVAVDKARSALPAPKAAGRSAATEAERFGVAMLRPDENASVSPRELEAAYRAWCVTCGLEPLPRTEIAPALGRMFRGVGLEIEADGSARGVAVRR